VTVRKIRRGESTAGLQILFIGGSDAARIAAVLVSVKGQPILTVTESENALAMGSNINFVIVGDKVRFDIAPRQAESQNLKISARMLAVARKIIALKAVIGGEGNGGVMYPALHVGRDAPLAAALVLTLLARERATVSELVERAPRYTIVKAKAPRGARLELVYDGLRQRFPDAVVDTQDGLRLAWPDRWLHVRPSGTEPIIRFIAEAPSRADAERLTEEGRRLCAAS